MTRALLRPAQKSDAAEIAALVSIATHGIVNDMWALDAAADQTYSTIEIGRIRVLTDDDGFNWRKATMATVEDEVVGMLLGARDPDVPTPVSPDMPPYMVPFFELAVHAPGAWYISMLAVHLRWRGHGIGEQLLECADAKRAETAARGLSLVVEDINTGARKLYERHGFGVRARRPMIPFPSGRPKGREWLLMVKE